MKQQKIEPVSRSESSQIMRIWVPTQPQRPLDEIALLLRSLGGELAGWEEITPIFQSILLASNWESFFQQVQQASKQHCKH